MARHHVEVGRDHVSRLASATALKAIEELIWNGLDAGGRSVEVRLSEDAFRAVSQIEVIDRGSGIRPEELKRAFGKIGESIKLEKKLTPEGRALHGREGSGRFKALALCPTVHWETTYSKNGAKWTYTITISRDGPDYYVATDPLESKKEHTGTRVILKEIEKGKMSLASDEAHIRLAEAFAAYLTSYPKASVTYNGTRILIDDLIEKNASLSVLPEDHPAGPATLNVIEWTSKVEGRRLHICSLEGFSYHDITASVRGRGIDYTAYLRTPVAAEWEKDNRLATAELDNEICEIINAARDRLRSYIRGRLAEKASSIIDEWKSENIYPYSAEDGNDPISVAERQVFDIVAAEVHDHHPTFKESDRNNKQLTLALIRQALERNPSGIAKILQEIVSLSEKEQQALVELLERTPLSNLIRAGALVSERLDTIGAFEHKYCTNQNGRSASWRERSCIVFLFTRFGFLEMSTH